MIVAGALMCSWRLSNRDDVPNSTVLYRQVRQKLEELITGPYALADIKRPIAGAAGGAALRKRHRLLRAV